MAPLPPLPFLLPPPTPSHEYPNLTSVLSKAPRATRPCGPPLRTLKGHSVTTSSLFCIRSPLCWLLHPTSPSSQDALCTERCGLGTRANMGEWTRSHISEAVRWGPGPCRWCWGGDGSPAAPWSQAPLGSHTEVDACGQASLPPRISRGGGTGCIVSPPNVTRFGYGVFEEMITLK